MHIVKVFYKNNVVFSNGGTIPQIIECKQCIVEQGYIRCYDVKKVGDSEFKVIKNAFIIPSDNIVNLLIEEI